MRAIELAPNRPRQFYLGGSVLAAFRGQPAEDDHRPEDWIASTTSLSGTAGYEGLTRLPDHLLLRDAVRGDPEAWLGPAHAAAIGADPALLVKLLHAGERLPVHVHPTRAFARRHLGSRYGKTEAWVVLETSGEAQVHLGFARNVEAAELGRWIDAQDTAAMLANLHALDVTAGDTVFVPAGLPHAIGAGIFCLELQEPTDFSVMLEWESYGRLETREGRLGLDAELARECVQLEALGPERLQRLRSSASRATWQRDDVQALFPEEADGFFRAERIRSGRAPVRLAPGFSILVVLTGHGHLESASGDKLALRQGSTTLIPHAAGQTVLSGPLVAVRCSPPSVQSALDGGLEGLTSPLELEEAT